MTAASERHWHRGQVVRCVCDGAEQTGVIASARRLGRAPLVEVDGDAAPHECSTAVLIAQRPGRPVTASPAVPLDSVTGPWLRSQRGLAGRRDAVVQALRAAARGLALDLSEPLATALRAEAERTGVSVSTLVADALVRAGLGDLPSWQEQVCDHIAVGAVLDGAAQ